MSGYGEIQSYETHGVQTISGCEDWYGVGDPRCKPDYVPSGELEKDIEMLNGQIDRLRYEAGRRDCYSRPGCQEEKNKQIESLVIILKEKELKKKLRR